MTQVTLDVLHGATSEEATGFFADTDAEALVEALRRTGDEELRALVGRDEIRLPAVRGVLSRLHEYADPDRLAALSGTVRIDLTRDDARLGHHLLRIGSGTITVDTDVPASAASDVVLGTTVVGFVRLVSGQGNAALDFLAGRLHVEGDAALALAVGGLFTIPGTDEVAVDPTALDPVDVARALTGVPVEHLREVAKAHGATPARVALAWLLHKPAVTAPIIGVSRASQLEDALAALSLGLTPPEIERLEADYTPRSGRGFL